MIYKLKKNQETFQVIDGPLAGTTYHRGKVYDQIPDIEKHRFEKIKPVAATPKPSTGKLATKEKKK